MKLPGTLISGWDSLRSSYWFLPMGMALGAAVLAIGLVELDDALAGQTARPLAWIQRAGPDGTRAVLSVIAGSMITVTGVVFSIMIVALTLASSQFGPRLLRNFLRDRGNQLTLGTFVATFLYSLLVLRAVEADRVPYIATALGVGLAITSLFVLIYFVHHAASSIQASSVIAAVANEIEAEIPVLFPESLGEEAGERDPAVVDTSGRLEKLEHDGRDVLSEASGYVRVVDPDTFLACAVEHDLLIRLERRPGDFVAAQGRLARLGPAERANDDVIASVREGFVLGDHRTAVQDLAFLTDQLAEMAVRALSPGVNDPGTAIACIHRLGVVVATVAGRPMPSQDRYDAERNLRIVAEPTTLEGIVASCFDPIRRYGAGDAGVVVAVLEALAGAFGTEPDAKRGTTLLAQAIEMQKAFAETRSCSGRDCGLVQVAFERVEAHARSSGITSAEIAALISAPQAPRRR